MPSLFPLRAKTWVILLLIPAIAGLGYGGYLLKKRHDRTKHIQADTMPLDEAAARAETESLQTQMMDAIPKGQFAGVIANAQLLVQRHPTYVPARVLLAQVLLSVGQYPQSYEQIKQALSLPTPTTPSPRSQAELQLLAGTIAQKAERPDLAQAHLSTAVSLMPHEIRPRLMLATSLMNTQKYDQARDVILMALTIDQRSHKAYALLADLYRRQNQIALAIDQIQKAIDLVPLGERATQVDYLRVKAGILRRANQPDQAMQVLLALKPKERLALSNLEEMALCLAMQGKPQEAAALVESRLEVDPADDVTAVRAAQWYLKAGDKKNARRLAALARSINPANRELQDLERSLAR